VALSKKCSDLLKQDLKETEARCHGRHHQRIWEQLEPKDRDALRRQVITEDPSLADEKWDFVIEGRCVSEIEKEIKRSGKVTRNRKRPAPSKSTTWN